MIHGGILSFARPPPNEEEKKNLDFRTITEPWGINSANNVRMKQNCTLRTAK